MRRKGTAPAVPPTTQNSGVLTPEVLVFCSRDIYETAFGLLEFSCFDSLSLASLLLHNGRRCRSIPAHFPFKLRCSPRPRLPNPKRVAHRPLRLRQPAASRHPRRISPRQHRQLCSAIFRRNLARRKRVWPRQPSCPNQRPRSPVAGCTIRRKLCRIRLRVARFSAIRVAPKRKNKSCSFVRPLSAAPKRSAYPRLRKHVLPERLWLVPAAPRLSRTLRSQPHAPGPNHPQRHHSRRFSRHRQRPAPRRKKTSRRSRAPIRNPQNRLRSLHSRRPIQRMACFIGQCDFLVRPAFVREFATARHGTGTRGAVLFAIVWPAATR